jgi:glycosyltransferase involved in cell wall biosynthesis
MRLVFVLPARAGGGGVHSVVQEAAELAKLGAEVSVLVPQKHVTSFRIHYDPTILSTIRIRVYEGAIDPEWLAEADVAIATVFTSVRLVADALTQLPKESWPIPAYYIQDYEPLFCLPKTRNWNEAMSSFTLLDDALLFAKTEWLCRQVETHHRCSVQRVAPSLDHAVYFPRLDRPNEPLVVSAMLRPATPRRAPRRTARILSWLAESFPGRVELHAFGATEAELRAHGVIVNPAVELHGSLRREGVAELLRSSHVFLDLSDYQAFGRTGLEAMASGCIPVLPRLGGAGEFLKESINGFTVDTADDKAITALLQDIVSLGPRDLGALTRQALQTASEYSVRRAAVSEYAMLAACLEARGTA